MSLHPSLRAPTSNPNLPRVTVVCDDAGAYHEKRGTTTVATFTHDGGRWAEDAGRSRATERRLQKWWDSLTENERESIANGDPNRPRSQFGEAPDVGRRPPAVTYLRGETPAVDSYDRAAIMFAIHGGTSASSRGGTAEPADLAGREQVEISCGCGLSRRARAEQLWPILTTLTRHGITRVTLRALIRRLDTPRA